MALGEKQGWIILQTRGASSDVQGVHVPSRCHPFILSVSQEASGEDRRPGDSKLTGRLGGRHASRERLSAEDRRGGWGNVILQPSSSG